MFNDPANWRRSIAALAITVAATACAAPGRHQISGFGDPSFRGFPRGYAHAGIDFDAAPGEAVLAASHGSVWRVYDDGDCGNGVLLLHQAFRHFTLYCHLSRVRADLAHGVAVERGELLGWAGDSGGARGDPHLHFEVCSAVCDGKALSRHHVDPDPLLVDCFDPRAKYPEERFVLTYPLSCRPTKTR
jgi:murein DD-endopeptidase MepM/ murein hydrolase activator NlpD